MPLFEYRCESSEKKFEKMSKKQEATAPCPDCGQEAFKAVSAFASSSCTAPSGSGFG